MDFKYLFFDLDGTLIDSRIRLHTLFNELAGRKKLSFRTYWSYKRAKRSNQWLLREVLNFSECEIKDFDEQWMNLIEEETYLALDTLFDDTMDSLERLSKRCDLFVVSARQFVDKGIAQLETLGINHYFKEVLITEQKKSKEEIIGALKLCLRKSNSMIVGDTGEETLAARALGMFSTSTSTGFRNRDVLASYKPDMIVSNLSQVCDFVLE